MILPDVPRMAARMPGLASRTTHFAYQPMAAGGRPSDRLVDRPAALLSPMGMLRDQSIRRVTEQFNPIPRGVTMVYPQT